MNNTKETKSVEFKQTYSVLEIEPLDDMILIKLPEINNKIGRIIVNDKLAKEQASKQYCEVLKVGKSWSALFPVETFTSIQVGDSIITDEIMAFSVTDYDYPNSVALIYRNDIKFKVNTSYRI
jgi:co-chaperonin GroES (HSP10)